jgi:hypothetical protein
VNVVATVAADQQSAVVQPGEGALDDPAGGGPAPSRARAPCIPRTSAVARVRWSRHPRAERHPRTTLKALARPRVRVAVPANCDTSPGSVGHRFRPATTCAADVIADVSEYTPAHSLRSHPIRPMLTPRQVEAAEVEPIVSAQPSAPNEQSVRHRLRAHCCKRSISARLRAWTRARPNAGRHPGRDSNA